MPDAPITPRARARAETTQAIKDIARREVAAHGAESLSLRAVARELGVVSSAIYRYVASRDELLTLLIIDAYDAVGAAAEAAAADTSGGFSGRWLRVARAVRAWALAHPHDYALVYGSPVSGYRAPADTVDPALRVSLAALGVVADGVRDGEVVAGVSPAPTVPAVRADLDRIRTGLDLELPDDVLARALSAWTGLFGHLSFELFGHLTGGVEDYDAFFEHQMAREATLLAGAPGGVGAP